MTTKTKVVLVVDDQGPVRRSVMRAVSAVGYEAQGAIDATDAVEKLRDNNAFDVVLTDYEMGDPERTGGWLLEFVKEHHPEIRRLLMSSRTANDPVIHAVLANDVAEAFLDKLIDRAALVAAVEAERRV